LTFLHTISKEFLKFQNFKILKFQNFKYFKISSISISSISRISKFQISQEFQEFQNFKFRKNFKNFARISKISQEFQIFFLLKYSIFYPLQENIYNGKIFLSEGILKTVIKVLTKKTPKKDAQKRRPKIILKKRLNPLSMGTLNFFFS